VRERKRERATESKGTRMMKRVKERLAERGRYHGGNMEHQNATDKQARETPERNTI
jgi:hypothetical protein